MAPKTVRPSTEEAEPVAAPPGTGSPDPIALAQLWADQFQHLATLGVAGAGGVLVMLQAQLIQTEGRWWLVLVLFVATAIFGMYGQIAVVDEATEGRPPGKKPRGLRMLALMCLGAAGGAAVGLFGL